MESGGKNVGSKLTLNLALLGAIVGLSVTHWLIGEHGWTFARRETA